MAKIMILEDDKNINDLIKLHLCNEGYEVVQAYDGQQCVNSFDEAFDLAILDIMVPYISGFEVLAHIRQSSEIPVIFLTATNDDSNKVLALGMGADDYVTKPFSVIEVVSRCKAHLRRYLKYANKLDDQGLGEMETNTVLENGPIKLDQKKMMVWVGNQEVKMNAKEFKLLQFFLENVERVFTKKQLYEQVWEEPYYGDDNTVMVHISRLRERVETQLKNQKFITTIKGLGYRMEAL